MSENYIFIHNHPEARQRVRGFDATAGNFRAFRSYVLTADHEILGLYPHYPRREGSGHLPDPAQPEAT